MGTGFIYLIGSPDQDAGKIGWTADPADRLIKAQTNNPALLELLWQVPGTRVLEGTIHQELKPLHIRGEWYRDLMRLTLIIGELVDLWGSREFDGEVSDLTSEDVQRIARHWLAATKAELLADAA